MKYSKEFLFLKVFFLIWKFYILVFLKKSEN